MTEGRQRRAASPRLFSSTLMSTSLQVMENCMAAAEDADKTDEGVTRLVVRRAQNE